MACDLIQEKHEEKQVLAAQIKELGASPDEWSAEDRSSWDTLNAAYDLIDGEIAEITERAERAVRLAHIEESAERQESARKTEVGQARQIKSGRPTEEQRALALQAFFRAHAGRELKDRHKEALAVTGMNPSAPEFKSRWARTFAPNGLQKWQRGTSAVPGEQRADLQVGTDSEGGYTVPEGFMTSLETALSSFGGLRNIAQIVSTSTGSDIPWPTLDDTGNTGELLAEEASIGSSVAPTFGVVTLKAYKYSSKPILVSAELLEDSAFNLAAILGSALGERIGRITSTHYATGDASSKPQGVTVGASAGVTAAGAAAVTSDEVIALQESLDPAYQSFPSTGWAFHQSTRKAIRQLKDGDDQYLWQPGLRAGEPDLILGRPYSVVQDMPEMATGVVSIVYGAFEKYIIRDAGAARFFRLDELYRANDQTGFVMFSRHDGRVLQTNALKKLPQA